MESAASEGCAGAERRLPAQVTHDGEALVPSGLMVRKGGIRVPAGEEMHNGRGKGPDTAALPLLQFRRGHPEGSASSRLARSGTRMHGIRFDKMQLSSLSLDQVSYT